MSQVLPWKSYEEMLQAAVAPLAHLPGSINAKDGDEFWTKTQEQGGWWSAEVSPAQKAETNQCWYYQNGAFSWSISA
jgi:hypothetical protein